ncbi:hypothetical protein ACFFSH_22085 [Streptomyces filamentosus]|uniref:Uncharacterized protein n=1 Tax=Streptomyces filamentosus TaxID=67294 RepID=A0A919EKA6_STRFL|nr:hypothetical protein [Streptomyces filamentosus]KAA6218545.1 hypothetical protein CP979_17715 [Streptomyces filamentosus]GHF93910.1 hypothetical protein GCM10017667_24940 [Streptomyces filamentosus]
MSGQTVAATPRAAAFPKAVRAAVALQALALFFQTATAGALIASSSRGALLHDAGSRVMYGATMLYVLAAIVAWRPGGGSPRPVLYATGFLVLASVQVVLGVAHLPAFHVPLGVAMVALGVLDLARVLTRPTGPR